MYYGFFILQRNVNIAVFCYFCSHYGRIQKTAQIPYRN